MKKTAQNMILAAIVLLAACTRNSDIPIPDTPIDIPKLPLEYVAEYNLNSAGDGFATTHNVNASGYFNWFEVTGTVNPYEKPSGENILNKPNFKGWHLPSLNEWCGIFAKREIFFNKKQDELGVTETVEIAGETKNYTADYKNDVSQKIAYAIKMKGNGDTYRVAYRYKMEGTEGGDDYRLVVRCKYLGAAGTDTTIEDVANEGYWTSYNVERTFPACGQIFREFINVGFASIYWSATTWNNDAYRMLLKDGRVRLAPSLKWCKNSIRLFSD